MEQPLARTATRLAISVNNNANYTALQRFIDNPEIKPLHMKDIGDILDSFLRFEDEIISVDTKTGSSPFIPAPPATSRAGDVW